MKYYVIIVLAAFYLAICTTCSDMPSEDKKTKIEVFEDSYVCQGKTYSSDEECLRAKGVGSSRNEQIARRKANTNANANLAAKISEYRQNLKGSTSAEQNEDNIVKTETTNHSRKVINERLVNVRVVCAETVFENDMYMVSVIVEMAVNDIEPLILTVGFTNFFDKY